MGFLAEPDCTPFVEVIKLGYTLSNSSGVQFAVLVTEDAALSQVINVTKESPTSFGSTIDSYVWAGYNYYDSTLIRSVGANWNEPSAAEAGTNECNGKHCDYGFWVGVTTDDAGNSGIVQTGTDSGLYCLFGTCNGDYYYYTFWQDTASGFSASYTCFNINVGDQITAKTYFDHYDSVHKTWYFDTYLKDNSNGKSCSSLNDGMPNTAHYAQFVGERPIKSGSLANLPKFSPTVTVTGGNYVNSAGSTITIGSGWTEENIMDNNVNKAYSCNGVNSYQNICNGPVSNGGFTETWDTSQGAGT